VGHSRIGTGHAGPVTASLPQGPILITLCSEEPSMVGLKGWCQKPVRKPSVKVAT